MYPIYLLKEYGIGNIHIHLESESIQIFKSRAWFLTHKLIYFSHNDTKKQNVPIKSG